MKLLEKILISTEIAYHLKNRKKFNELVKERSSGFKDLQKNN